MIKKYPLLLISISLCTGIFIGYILYYNIPLLINYYLTVVNIILLSILVFAFYKTKNYYVLNIIVLLCGFLLIHRITSIPNYYVAYKNKTIYAIVKIISEPAYKKNYVKLTVKPVSLKTNQYILLTQYNPKIKYTTNDYLYANMKIDLPKAKTNPYGFDYSMYLKRQNIYATANLVNSKIIKKGTGIKSQASFLKDYCNNIIYKNLNEPYSSIVSSLVLGYSLDNDEINTDLRNSGIIHIMAVSGLQVSIIVALVSILLKPLKNDILKDLIIILFIIGYSYLVGFAAPVIRTDVMVILIIAGKWFRRMQEPLNSLCLATILLLSLNPLELFDVSFQLSFVATASIIIFYKSIYERIRIFPGAVSKTAAITISSQLGIIPFIIYYFYSIPLMSVITNILVIPVVSLLMPLSFMLILIGHIPILNNLISLPIIGVIKYILTVSNVISHIPFSYINIPFPDFWWIIVYYIFIFYLNGTIKLAKKYLYLLFTLALSLSLIKFTLPQPLTVTYLDVGQGDAAFITTPDRHTLLIDGGRLDLNTGYDAGKSVILPYLYRNGIFSIDYIMSSHPDSDHIGGLLSVVKGIKCKNYVAFKKYDDNISKQIENIFKKNNQKILYMKSGDYIKLHDIIIDIINPPPDTYDNDNDNSLVEVIKYKNSSFMFTGDIGTKAEDLLNTDINIDILKVSHHGSIYSTDKSFLDKTTPCVSIISVGKNNYGQPSDKVINMLNKSIIYRTDLDGAITVRTNGYSYKIHKFVSP